MLQQSIGEVKKYPNPQGISLLALFILCKVNNNYTIATPFSFVLVSLIDCKQVVTHWQ